MKLFFFLFLFFSSVSPGLQQEDTANLKVVDEIIRLFDEMAAPSDNYFDALTRFEKTIPSFLNLSSSFGGLFYFPETFGNENIPDAIVEDTMDIPSLTKLYNHLKKYDIDRLTFDELEIKRSHYYTMAAIKNEHVNFSLIRDISIYTNIMFKLGYMEVLNPQTLSGTRKASIKTFHKTCSELWAHTNEEDQPKTMEQNKSTISWSSHEDITLLLDEMEDFLTVYDRDYKSRLDNYYSKKSLLKFLIPFKSIVLSIDDIDEARETVKRMKKKLQEHNWETDQRLEGLSRDMQLEEKAKIILEEADNVAANKKVNLLDMIHGYDIKEILAFVNDYHFDTTRMLAYVVLCAASEPKNVETALQRIGTVRSAHANNVREYFHNKLRNANISVEERVAKQILKRNVENRREESWFGTYVTTTDERLDVGTALSQLSESLSDIGPETIRRQYLISKKHMYTWTAYRKDYDTRTLSHVELYQNYFTCKQESCFIVPGIAGTDTLVTRHVEANETEVEEFANQTKVLYRKIMPLIGSRSKEWDTVEKIVGEIKSRGISLTDTRIGSVAIIRHRAWRGSSCNFFSYTRQEDRGEDSLPTMRHYQMRHRAITGFWGFDYYACTEVYFFM